ncbi:PAS domain-containing protein (plasmid) [Sinorhizobium chiapasense]|uniref:PAS domain-containing protein n=1 Tax=Sinorhizobium chiapasense TaxID=501572 RepID=UPI002FE0D18E
MTNSKRFLKTPDLKLRIIEERCNLGVWTWEIESSEVTWSNGLFRILGFEPASVVPTIDLYQSLVHPDDQLDFSNAVGLASDKRLADRTFRIIRPDGSLRWVRSKAQPHFDRNGSPIAMMGIVADVTDVQELKASLNGEKKLNHILSRLLGGHIWRAYPDGKLVETSEWSKLTGQSPAEARNWDELAAIHPDDRSKFRQAWATAIATGKMFRVTMRVKDLAGRYVRLKGQALAVRDETGEIVEWVGYTDYLDDHVLQPATDEPLTPGQIRAARALLNWTAPELAKVAGVSFSTVRRLESSAVSVRQENLRKVRSALERHGVRFFRDLKGGVSVGLSTSTANT